MKYTHIVTHVMEHWNFCAVRKEIERISRKPEKKNTCGNKTFIFGVPIIGNSYMIGN